MNNAVIHELVRIVIYLVVVGLIFGVLWWALSQIQLPEPFGKVARVVLIVLSALIVIGILLSISGSIGGYPLLRS